MGTLPLEGREIVVGVTGGIAAYKAVEVVSRLKKLGAGVHVVMTREATEFVTELTFREISGQQVAQDMWEKAPQYHVEHIALARLADLVLVVPATANILAKAAAGLADDLLATTLLATKAPVYFAPAMNTGMWENPATHANIKVLKQRGLHIIEPASGRLACDTVGKGRLPEPEAIVAEVLAYFAGSQRLQGRKVLVTAAGTEEPLDPVRFLGNRSTGRMGYALAEAAAQAGAEAVLVSGPSSLADPAGVRVIRVRTALEMQQAVQQEAEADIIIGAAAVADYRPAEVAAQKIKKGEGELTLRLVRNPDILAGLGAQKRAGQVLVGFAAETTHVAEYAQKKLQKKNLDFIVANDVSEADAGFGVSTNRVQIFYRDGRAEQQPLMEKRALAALILERAAACLN